MVHSLVIKGSLTDAWASASRFNVRLYLEQTHMTRHGLYETVARTNSPLRDIAAWYAADAGQVAPFAPGSLLIYSEVRARETVRA